MKPIERIKHSDIINNDDESAFEKLIDAIINDEVILMVGNNFEFNTRANSELLSPLGENANLSDYILSVLNNLYGCNAVNFSDLECDPKFSYTNDKRQTIKSNIYNEIYRTVNECELSLSDVSDGLKKLLSTGYFRFVITTSFYPLLEMAMKEQWGELNVDVLNIFDSDITKRDIENTSDYQIPTIYYLLGKLNKTQKFVVTDNDCLRAMKNIMVEMNNSNLMEFVSSKYLLVLGCNQENWLFRFIWHSLKGNDRCHKGGSVGRDGRDEPLERFLIRNGIGVNHNSEQFAEKIYDALMKRKKTNLDRIPNDQNWDVFISYSRKDGEVAKNVYDALTKAGVKAWYDKSNLGGRGEIFMSLIHNVILRSTIFVPILSNTITQQRTEIHPYRKEWEWAVNETIGMRGTVSCIPLIEDDYDLNKRKEPDRIPEQFCVRDGEVYNKHQMDFSEWAEKVKELIDNKM